MTSELAGTPRHTIVTYLIWKPIILGQFHVIYNFWANRSIMLKRSAKVAFYQKSVDFLTNLWILTHYMWLYANLDSRFEFLGQFWSCGVHVKVNFYSEFRFSTCAICITNGTIFLHFIFHLLLEVNIPPSMTWKWLQVVSLEVPR